MIMCLDIHFSDGDVLKSPSVLQLDGNEIEKIQDQYLLFPFNVP